MSLLRSFDLLASPSLPPLSREERLANLAELTEGADHDALLDLAGVLLGQLRASSTPWRPQTMVQWLT